MAITSPGSGPDEAHPLSDRERRILGELDDNLTEDAPELAETFATAEVPPNGSTVFTPDRVASAFAILVILVVLLPAEWLAALAVIGVLVGATAIGIWLGPRDAGTEQDPDPDNR